MRGVDARRQPGDLVLQGVEQRRRRRAVPRPRPPGVNGDPELGRKCEEPQMRLPERLAARVERQAANLEAPGPAADPPSRLEHDDPPAGLCEPAGGRQPGEPGPDDDGVGVVHAASFAA